MSISVLPNRYGLIEKVALSCIPKKKSPVALTFHNILPSQKSWFIDVIDLVFYRSKIFRKPFKESGQNIVCCSRLMMAFFLTG